MAHPYASKIPGAAKAKTLCRADGGQVKEFPISLKEADSNRMRFERGVSTISKKYGMNPDELRDRMRNEYSAPVLRMPGVPKRDGGRT